MLTNNVFINCNQKEYRVFSSAFFVSHLPMHTYFDNDTMAWKHFGVYLFSSSMWLTGNSFFSPFPSHLFGTNLLAFRWWYATFNGYIGKREYTVTMTRLYPPALNVLVGSPALAVLMFRFQLRFCRTFAYKISAFFYYSLFQNQKEASQIVRDQIRNLTI